MKLHSDLPVYKSCYDLLLEIFLFTKEFSKEYKYTVGESLTKSTMNINPFERVETNGKRLKTDLSLIFNRIDKNDIVNIYAMRIYNCYSQL